MDNSKENIKSLLDAYWAGESTLDQEAQLTSYFTSSSVDEELKMYVPLFSFFTEEKKHTVNLEDQIMAKINATPAITQPVTKVIRMSWQRAISIAASLLLVITIGFNMYRTQQQKAQDAMASVDTFDSPEQALAQTKAALLYISSRMNKGADKATLSISKTKSLDIIN